MRNILRIDKFLERVDVARLVKAIKRNFEGFSSINEDESIAQILKTINSKDFISYWKDNQDLRFGQLLFNLNVDFADSIYNYEEDEILQLCGLSPTQSNIWVSRLDRDGNLLETPVAKFIDELDTNHLLKMLDEDEKGERDYPEKYVVLFLMEVTKRSIQL